MVGAPATAGPKGGPSAGVALWAPSGRAHLGPVPGRGHDLSPPGGGGRLAAAWLDLGGCAAGLMAFSIYCWVNTELEEAPNLQLLEALATATRAHGGPWICAGDWNAEPADLERCGWLTALKARVVAAPTAALGSGRLVDFFVVDERLCHAVEAVWAPRDWLQSAEGPPGAGPAGRCKGPHRPVLMALNLECKPQVALMRREPKPFPRSRPMGPPAGPACWVADAAWPASAAGLWG